MQKSEGSLRYSKVPIKTEEQIEENIRKWRLMNLKFGILFCYMLFLFLIILVCILVGLYVSNDDSALVGGMTISLFGISFITMICTLPLCLTVRMDDRCY